jgi:FKBP-type peptidyl-prolyl cis-trans isomerase FkpA
LDLLRTILFISLPVMLLFSCTTAVKDEVVTEDEIREKFIEANKTMVQNEAEEIESYIARNKIKHEKSGTGLRYTVLHEGEGPQPTEGHNVYVEYRMWLIDGTLVYETKENEPFQFTPGRAQTIKGLEEGIMKIGKGGEVMLIVPSHLGYGIQGDGASIPGSTPLIIKARLREKISHQ